MSAALSRSSLVRDLAGHGVRARDLLAQQGRLERGACREKPSAATGHEVITRFPAEKLLIAGAPYITVSGPLETTRELEPEPNQDVVNMIAASARSEVGAR